VKRRAALLALPALAGCSATRPGGGRSSGEAAIPRLAALASHDSMAGEPDAVLRWNAIPRGAPELRVVMHFHGFTGPSEALRLSQRLHGSGLVFPASPPTVGIMVRGRPSARRAGSFDWPALAAPGGMEAVVMECLAALGPGLPPVTRLVLTAHSGGGGGLLGALNASSSGRARVDEAHFHDALYGDSGPALRWISARVSAERSGAPRCALLVIARPGSSTERPARSLAAGLARAGLGSPTRRVLFTAAPHNDVALLFGPALLVDAGAALPGTVSV